MRFISRFDKFGMQVRPIIEEGYATGIVKTIQEPIYAMFSGQGLLIEEREYAYDIWRGQWNGSYQAEDEVTTIPPDNRIGVFDSVAAQAQYGWSDEVRIAVENELIKSSELYNDVAPVPVVRIPPPWPRYDEYTGTPAALVRKLIDEGHDLSDVLAYERENQNRVAVIGELEELLNDPEAFAEIAQEEVVG